MSTVCLELKLLIYSVGWLIPNLTHWCGTAPLESPIRTQQQHFPDSRGNEPHVYLHPTQKDTNVSVQTHTRTTISNYRQPTSAMKQKAKAKVNVRKTESKMHRNVWEIHSGKIG